MKISLDGVISGVVAFLVSAFLISGQVTAAVSDEPSVKIDERKGTVWISWSGNEGIVCQVGFGQTEGLPLLQSVGTDFDRDGSVTENERLQINSLIKYRGIVNGKEFEAEFDKTGWKVSREPWGVKVIRQGVSFGSLKGFLEYKILPGSSMVPCVLWLKAGARCELTEIEHRLDFPSAEGIRKVLSRKKEDVFSSTNQGERSILDWPLASALHAKCVVVGSEEEGTAFGLTMPPHNWFQGYPTAVDRSGDSGSIGMLLFTSAWRPGESGVFFYGGSSKRFITLYYIGRGGQETYNRLTGFSRKTRYPQLLGHKVLSTHNHGTERHIKKLERIGVNLALWTNYGHELSPERWQEQLSALLKLNSKNFRVIPSTETSDASGPDGKYRGRLTNHMNYITPLPLLIRGAQRDAEGKYLPVSGEEGAERRARIAVEAGGLAWLNHPASEGIEHLVDNWTDDLFALEWNSLADIICSKSNNQFNPGLERPFFQRYEALLNAGRKIYIIAGTDDHSMTYIYNQGVVNYVHTESLEVANLIKALSNGDFFISTGEILIKDCYLDGARAGKDLRKGSRKKGEIKLSLKWTYPLSEIRIISNKGQELVDRPVKHQEFGEQSFQFPVGLEGREWMRVEVWDVANNQAFSQPIFISEAEPASQERQAKTRLTKAAAEELDGWKLAFSDNFERSLPGSEWKPISGKWSIDNGKLFGDGQILCAWRFPGPQRVEYDACSRDISPIGDHQVCDLSAFLASGDKGLGNGYFFGFGSNGNTRSKLTVKGEEIASYDKTITLFKTHHVVCEFDGTRLRHEIDGQVFYDQEIGKKLAGVAHEQVGFYLWLPSFIDNVRIYTRTGESIAPQKRSISLAPPPDTSLIKNGSFEKVAAGVRPPVPVNWVAQGWTRDDRVKLLTDITKAHRGQRFLRLSSAGEHGIRMHSVQQGFKKLKPGTTYLIRLWARQAGTSKATLIIQPGDYKVEVRGRKWQMHEIPYTHPASAKPELGMFFEIQGGPADVDDVSMETEREPEPILPELQSDWRKLTGLPVDASWHRSPEGSAYQERVPIVVRETAGKLAHQKAVSVPIKAIFRTYNSDFVSPAKIRVVDSTANGAPDVPWGLIARYPDKRTDPYHAAADDLLVFLVDIPALSEKTYYVYLTDRQPAKAFAISEEIPEAVNIPSTYAHTLFLDVGESERPLSVSAHMDGDALTADIQGWIAQPTSAKAVSPDGKRSINLPLESYGRNRWIVTPGWQFPEDASEGVWNIAVTFSNESGIAGKITTPLVYGNAMWWDSNARRIFPDGPSRYGKTAADIAAARNEWEAFQVAVTSARGLKGVVLRPTDLTHANREAKIDASEITVELEEHSYLFANAIFRSGLSPAPLLPWREVDIPAGTQRVAWITVRVPKGIPAGLYTGAIHAESHGGWSSELPLKLHVFDFSLPDVLSFTPLIGCNIGGADVRENMPEDWETNLRKQKYFSYAQANKFSVPTSQQQTMLDLYRYLGKRHITPTVYGLFTSYGYKHSTYHANKKSIEIDFSLIDKIIALIDKERLDIKFLLHLGADRVRLPYGYIRLLSGEKEGKIIYGKHGTPEGEELFRLWLIALRDYLRPTGWADRTLLYTDDEQLQGQTDYGSVDELVTKYNDLIHSVAPEFRTFCADHALKQWHKALEGTDFFLGAMSETNLKQFKALGNAWWGVYNRPLYINQPLGNARITGLDCWLRGWKHQWQYHATIWNQDYWFNACNISYYPANAGYPNEFFVRWSRDEPGFYLIYPWPARQGPVWEPGQPAFSGSTHIEAIRESAEDYEYIALLEALADQAKDNSQQLGECRELLKRVRSFVRGANQGNGWRFRGVRATFVVDGDELQRLRSEMGRTIAAWKRR